MARVGCARRVCFDPGLHDHHCRSGEAPCCFCDWRCRGIKCVDRNLLAERRAAELAVGTASQIRTTRSNGLAGSVLSNGLSVGREPLIFAVRPHMDATTHLVRWDVPFAEARHPSVTLITEQGRECANVAVLVVAPHGLDEYPKHLVRFDKVLAVLCYEEALPLDRGYGSLAGAQPSVCAYLWVDSPWVRASRGRAEFLQWPELRHYVVFGGDSIVELLASGEPEMKRIDKITVLETKHAV